MGLTSALVGGGMGVGIQMFSNYAAKIPISRKPWMHVGLFFAGCYFGHKYPKWEKALAEDVNRLRVANGMPPLVGGNTWIRYQAPTEK